VTRPDGEAGGREAEQAGGVVSHTTYERHTSLFLSHSVAEIHDVELRRMRVPMARSSLWRAAAAAVAVLAVAAGCGGGKKSYTYTFTDAKGGGLAKGIYLSVTSPIPIPASAFKGGKQVDRPVGRQVCVIEQLVTHPPAKYPQFKGKTLTLRVYGATSIAKLICALAKKGAATSVLGR
jgi:hypothetical protein